MIPPHTNSVGGLSVLRKLSSGLRRHLYLQAGPKAGLKRNHRRHMVFDNRLSITDQPFP